MSRTILFAFIILAVIFLLGCSSAGNSPIGPGTGDADLVDFKLPDGFQGHYPWGVWDLYIDPDSGYVEVNQVREALKHFDVTSYVVPPECADCLLVQLKNFNKDTRVAEIDITLKNPTTITGYDVRGILLLNEAGHDIKNPDGWTDVFDDGVPPEFNPFKRFAKLNEFGAFPGGESYKETYLILLPKPPNYGAIRYVIDAIFPKNSLREPYVITGEVADGSLFSDGSNVINFSVVVHDRNDDTESVTVACDALWNGAKDMTNTPGSDSWTIQISNEKLAPAGFYSIIIDAHDSVVKWILRDKYQINVVQKTVGWMSNLSLQVAGTCTFDIAAIEGGPFDRGGFLVDGLSQCTQFFGYDEFYMMPTPAVTIPDINPLNKSLQPFPPERFDSAGGGGLAFSNSSEGMYQDGFNSIPLSNVVVSLDESLLYIDDQAGDNSAHYVPGSSLGVADICDGFDQSFYILWAETDDGNDEPVFRCYTNNYTTKKQTIGATIPEEFLGTGEGKFINSVDAIRGIDVNEIDGDNLELYILETVDSGAELEVFNVYTDSVTSISTVTYLRTFSYPSSMGDVFDFELLPKNPNYVALPDAVAMVVPFAVEQAGFYSGYINIYNPVTGELVDTLGDPDLPSIFEHPRHIDVNNGTFTIVATSEITEPELLNMIIFTFQYGY